MKELIRITDPEEIRCDLPIWELESCVLLTEEEKCQLFQDYCYLN
jgi:hypothetical protein